MKDSALLKEVSEIAHSLYEVANTIELDFRDEKWRTALKLKSAASDAYFYVAQVVGAGKSQSLEYDCISARKYLNTLNSMYKFAGKEGMIKLDPELVVKIDKLVAKIDAEQKAVQKEMKRRVEEELEPWLEKYRIWQKISKN